MALGVSALGLSSAANFAISADPIQAGGFFSVSLDGDSESSFIDPFERRDASEWKASDSLLEAMIEEEGVRYDVYRDVAGFPTVGVGHLVLPDDNLTVGDTISHKRAMRFLEEDLAKAENGARDLVGDLKINQHEFDALVDLVFNVGIGTVSEEESPRLNAAIEAGNYEAIADELAYHSAQNQIAKGLVHRSERRAQIFLDGDYSDPRTG